MATAKQYAAQQLGALDLSYLDEERKNAQANYNTTKSSLDQSYNNLLDQLAKNRASAKKDFTAGRGTVAESAYNTNRANEASLASRGIGKSGLKQLGEIGNRIETGRQFSDLANTYYNTMDDISVKEKTGTQNYNLDLETATNDLNAALAGINSREKEAQNNYNLTLASLAEQIQSRWDANANAQAQLNQSKLDAQADRELSLRRDLNNLLAYDPNYISAFGKVKNLTSWDDNTIQKYLIDRGYAPASPAINPNKSYSELLPSPNKSTKKAKVDGNNYKQKIMLGSMGFETDW